MIKYRITKYDPCFRDTDGAYLKNDWTSFSDIGKVFSGQVLTTAEYIRVENAYLQAVNLIMEEFGITAMQVCNLEMYTLPLGLLEELEKKGLGLDDIQLGFLESLTESSKIYGEQLELGFRLQLRECFWCEWKDVRQRVTISFGYDFYMYITCERITPSLVDRIHESGLFVEIIEDENNIR